MHGTWTPRLEKPGLWCAAVRLARTVRAFLCFTDPHIHTPTQPTYTEAGDAPYTNRTAPQHYIQRTTYLWKGTACSAGAGASSRSWPSPRCCSSRPLPAPCPRAMYVSTYSNTTRRHPTTDTLLPRRRTHAQLRPHHDHVAAAHPDKAEGAGSGSGSTWEVPAKQLSACPTASEAMQQVCVCGCCVVPCPISLTALHVLSIHDIRS